MGKYSNNKELIRINKALQESGMSQLSISKKIDYSDVHLNYVLKGHKKMSGKMKVKLEEVLHQYITH